MSLGPFVVLANIHEQKLFTCVGAALHVRDIGFFDLFFRFVHQFQKLRRVGHPKTPSTNEVEMRIAQAGRRPLDLPCGRSGSGPAGQRRLRGKPGLSNSANFRSLPFLPRPSWQKSSPSVIFSREEASRQSRSSSFMSATRSPLPSPPLP